MLSLCKRFNPSLSALFGGYIGGTKILTELYITNISAIIPLYLIELRLKAFKVEELKEEIKIEPQEKAERVTQDFSAGKTTEEKLPLPSDMQTSFGGVMGWFFKTFFRHVNFSEEDIKTIRDCSEKGTVVYIMRSRSFIAFLFFNYAFLKYGLPLARFVNALPTKFFMSLRKLKEYRKRHIPGFTGSTFEEATRLNYLTRLGESSMIFLLPPRKAMGLIKAPKTDHLFTALIELQRKLEKPIYLIPMALLYNNQPENDPPSLSDILLRMSDNPHWLRDLLTFLWSHRQAKIRVSEPVDLKEYLEKENSPNDKLLSRKLKRALMFNLRREQEVVTGPPRLRPSHIKDLVLADPILMEVISKLSSGDPHIEAAMNKRAKSYVEEIAADMDLDHLAVFNWLLLKIWSLMKLVVRFRRAQLSNLRSYARKAPLVFCPAHRSHIDYLVVSQTLYYADFVPPHIAAGENLRFWPMGYIFRKSGAFFMRRTFKGDELYSAVFKAYIRRLMRGHYSVEFFIEGGRSRSGKMLRPKTGLLSMIYSAYQDGVCDDICFVPIYPMYEKLPEMGSYAEELMGAGKKKETLGALVKSSRFLGKRFGKVDLRFGEPLSLKSFLEERGVDPKNTDKQATRETVSALGYAISYAISEQAAVNSSFLLASALLENSNTMLAFEKIIDRSKLLIEIINGHSEKFAGGLRENLEERIKEAIALNLDDNNIKQENGKYQATPKGRVALDYYRNTCLHYYIKEAIAATALLSFGEEKVEISKVFERALALRDLLKFEFIFEVGPRFEEQAMDLLKWAENKGYIAIEGDFIRMGKLEDEELKFLRSFITPFIDGYTLATRTIADIEFKALFRADFVKKGIERGREIFELGGGIPPESCTKTTLDNAVSLLIENDLLEEMEETNDNPKGGILIPTERGKKIEERQKYVDYINGLTGREKPPFANITAPLHPVTAAKVVKD